MSHESCKDGWWLSAQRLTHALFYTYTYRDKRMAGRSLILQSLIQPPPVFSLSLILLSPSSTTNFVVVLKISFPFFFTCTGTNDLISAVPLSWFEYVASPFFQLIFFAHLFPAIVFKSIFKRDVLSAERPTADWRLRFSRVSRSCSGAKSSTDAGTSLRHTRVPELPHRGRAPTPGYQGSTLWYLPPAPFPFYNTRMSCDCYQKSKYFCIDNAIAL